MLQNLDLADKAKITNLWKTAQLCHNQHLKVEEETRRRLNKVILVTFRDKGKESTNQRTLVITLKRKLRVPLKRKLTSHT